MFEAAQLVPASLSEGLPALAANAQAWPTSSGLVAQQGSVCYGPVCRFLTWLPVVQRGTQMQAALGSMLQWRATSIICKPRLWQSACRWFTPLAARVQNSELCRMGRCVYIGLTTDNEFC